MSTSQENQEREHIIRMALADPSIPLSAISNIIELKPDKRYVFVFKGAEQSNVNYIWERLTNDGVHCSCIALSEGQDLSVIEYPMPEQAAAQQKAGEA